MTARTLLAAQSPLRGFGFSPGRLTLPVALALAGAVCEWLCALLLVPAVEGSIRLDFAAASHSAVFRVLLSPFSALSLSDREVFFALLAAIAATALLKTALLHAAAARFIALVHAVSGRARNGLFRACLGADRAFFDAGNSSRFQHVVVAQINSLSHNALFLQDSVTHALLLAAYATAMAWISWPLTLAVAMVLPVLHVAGGQLSAGLRKASLANTEAQGELGELVSDSWRNIALVHAENSQGHEEDRFAAVARRADSLQTDMDVRSSLTPKLQESIFVLMMVVMLLGLTFATGPSRSDVVPSLFVFVYLARRASVSALAVMRFKTAAAAMAGPMKDVESFLLDAEAHRSPDGDTKFPGLKEGLECRGLTLDYPNGTRALDDVSFHLSRGETLAVVGPSGAGKSSLAHVLLRFYRPTRGAFYLDGVDLSRFTAASLAPKIAFIPQSPQLLDDTLRNNLVYPGTLPSGETPLWEALRKAALLDHVEALPEGLDSRIGENGVLLSGGERQRLALARAILKDAPLLVLDEATSALDSATEDLVRKSIVEATAGRTAIIIAHRLSTVKHADRVLVLDRGKAVQTGTFETLRATKGVFRDMLERQDFA